MSVIRVRTDSLSEISSKLTSAMNNISEISNEFYNTYNQIDWEVKSKLTLFTAMNKLKNSLDDTENDLYRHTEFLKNTIDKYNEAEGFSKSTNMLNNNLYSNGNNNIKNNKEDKLRDTKVIFANIFKGNKDFLFNDDQMLYKLLYKEMYVDNLTGHIVDKVSEYVTENEVNEDKYITILSSLLAMYDMNFEDAVNSQSSFDTDKSIIDYGFDIFDIVSGTISPESGSKGEVVQETADLVKDIIENAVDGNEKVKLITVLGASTQYKKEILDAIYNSTDDEQLKLAIIKTKKNLTDKTNASIKILATSRYDSIEKISDAYYKQRKKELKDILINPENKSQTNNLDKSAINDRKNKVDGLGKLKEGAGSFKTGCKLGLFAGDMILGSSDSINDVTSIKAIYEISQSLESNLVSETGKFGTMNMEEMKILTAKYEFLTDVHLNGEYIANSLITNDMKLFSLLMGKEKINDANHIYDVHSKYLSQINGQLKGLY